MRISLALLLTLFTTAMVAQKRLSQTYDAASIKELYINSNEIFEITITAADTDQITVHTIIDGEIFASTLLNTDIAKNVLKITTGKTPDYEPFNDKLSAHKVMAIELEITVPVGLDISVYSTLAGVDTQGTFGQVHMDLGRGHFKGEGFRFRESATINTISGSIYLDIDKASITAQSRNGTIVISPEITLGSPITLESIHGDITIVKSL
ncbi:hypothetical protein [uncultured Dokdonia sp.]|uniref:hypothetical protein n=1 Tax=Dokdonia sp. R78006 TaxID=3093866 RepID=UPI002610B6F7|nr:hypothetical protein [uncultured Dokdonia sp.]